MTMQPGWVPPGVDTGKANIARVYDWWLGGHHNFRADQDAARAMIAIEPNARAIARANRAFLGRAVRYLAAEAGIRQFLDIGSGIPTENNVHQVAQAADPWRPRGLRRRRRCRRRPQPADPGRTTPTPPSSRPTCASRPRSWPTRTPSSCSTSARRSPCSWWRCCTSSPTPTARTRSSHGCATRSPQAATWSSATPAGTPAPTPPRRPRAVYQSRVAAQGRARTRAEIAGFFDGFTLVDPGLVWMPQWRPDNPEDVPEDPEKFWFLAGVGRLTEP